MTTIVSRLGLAAGVSLLAGPLATASTLPTIDDFMTGPVTILLNGATQTGDLVKVTTQRGTHILGGTRLTILSLSLAGNPFHLNAELKIQPATASAPAALTMSQGFQQSGRLDMDYGNSVNKPLNVDFTQYDRFRVHFLALEGDQDIVLETFSAKGNGEWGCSLASSPYHPVVVDMPFANSPGADLSKVTELGVISQGGAYGYNTGISLIEVVKAGTPPADVTCPQIQETQRAAQGPR